MGKIEHSLGHFFGSDGHRGPTESPTGGPPTQGPPTKGPPTKGGPTRGSAGDGSIMFGLFRIL